MSFPFSIIGIIVYLFYIFIVILVVVLPLRQWILKNKRWQWWAINPIAFIFIIAPVAEEFWIQYQFKTFCNDAGVQVVRQVVVEGYYDATKNDMTNENKNYDDPKGIERMEKSGFSFIERRTNLGKVRHLEIKNGKIEQTILDKPEARYHFKYSFNNNVIAWKIKKIQRIVMDTKNNEVIGSTTIIKRYPGWVENIWIRFIGSGMNMCPIPDKPPYQPSFPEAVLKPKNL